MPEKIRNETKTIGTTTVLIRNEYPDRTVNTAVYVNTSTGGQVITLAWDAEASAGAGITLNPGAGWSESIDNVFVPSTKRVTAVASAAGGTLAIHERVI